jgi:acetyl esterase/lipase
MSGVPDDLAGQLRALGPGFNLPQVQTLYAPLLAQQPRDGVQCSTDEVYGSHQRHRLDVYRPEAPVDRARPLLVMLHGGGFVRGDKAQRSNFGWWAAREGFIALLPNYRLAPESRWPSGPEDVVAIWRWVRAHAERLGGDPTRVVLMGESAGAAHVAAASLCLRFQPTGWRVAAAVLLSGPYDARLESLARVQFGIATPDPRNDAYFGTEPSAAAAASIVDRIDAAPFPLLIGYAERDLLQMQVQAGELFARLVTSHGFAPALHCWREHNHFSQGYSFGTSDVSVSRPVADFIRQHTGFQPERSAI